MSDLKQRIEAMYRRDVLVAWAFVIGLWFAIIFVINMELAYLTPPFGFNLFYMKAVTPPGITMMDIYKSQTPFVLLMIFGLVLCLIFPQIVLWLPSLMVT